MSAIKGRVVSLSQGNVYRCEFGRAEAAGGGGQRAEGEEGIRQRRRMGGVLTCARSLTDPAHPAFVMQPLSRAARVKVCGVAADTIQKAAGKMCRRHRME